MTTSENKKAPPSAAPQGGGRFAPATLGYVIVIGFDCWLILVVDLSSAKSLFAKGVQRGAAAPSGKKRELTKLVNGAQNGSTTHVWHPLAFS